jgi:hypothetical protein
MVGLVSVEDAQPEIRTAASASTAKAIILFFITVNSRVERNLDVPNYFGIHAGLQ